MRMIVRTRHLSPRDASSHIWTLLLITACTLVCEAAPSAAEIWVITDREHQMQVARGIRLIELDGPTRINSELFSQLPSDPVRASLIARQRLEHGGTELEVRLATTYQGVIDAWNLGVTKIPAVVVDRRYVIYGERDVVRALTRIEQYRRRSNP